MGDDWARLARARARAGLDHEAAQAAGRALTLDPRATVRDLLPPPSGDPSSHHARWRGLRTLRPARHVTLRLPRGARAQGRLVDLGHGFACVRVLAAAGRAHVVAFDVFTGAVRWRCLEADCGALVHVGETGGLGDAPRARWVLTAGRGHRRALPLDAATGAVAGPVAQVPQAEREAWDRRFQAVSVDDHRALLLDGRVTYGGHMWALDVETGALALAREESAHFRAGTLALVPPTAGGAAGAEGCVAVVTGAAEAAGLDAAGRAVWSVRLTRGPWRLSPWRGLLPAGPGRLVGLPHRSEALPGGGTGLSALEAAVWVDAATGAAGPPIALERPLRVASATTVGPRLAGRAPPPDEPALLPVDGRELGAVTPRDALVGLDEAGRVAWAVADLPAQAGEALLATADALLLVPRGPREDGPAPATPPDADAAVLALDPVDGRLLGRAPIGPARGERRGARQRALDAQPVLLAGVLVVPRRTRGALELALVPGA